MFNITMVFKSGKEYHFKCKDYSITKFQMTESLYSFSYKGGIGECPIYFQVEDIESIAVELEGDEEDERS